MPAWCAEPPALLAVHPDPAGWPENILRVHLCFSREMEPHDAASQVWIEAAGGVRVAGALVDLADGLWSRDGLILTLLFHPGRVKRGLAAHVEQGRALRAGAPAWLVAGPGLADLAGQPVAGPQRLAITITPALETAIDPAAWRWAQPAPGSRDPILIHTGRPLDALSVPGAVRLMDAAGRALPARLAASGPMIIATAPLPWPGLVQVAVADWLEDACGNRPGRAFEAAATALPAAPPPSPQP